MLNVDYIIVARWSSRSWLCQCRRAALRLHDEIRLLFGGYQPHWWYFQDGFEEVYHVRQINTYGINLLKGELTDQPMKRPYYGLTGPDLEMRFGA